MTILLIVLYLFLIIGVIFSGLGAIGLIRFPDVYTRLHSATKCTTFGSVFISLAVIIFGFYFWRVNGNSKYLVFALHTIIALACLIVTNSTGAHAIARAAYRSGVKPKHAVVDDLKEAKLK
ncbi:MAG: monovalent cation/H(+) antiporter subunit G [Atribacterota bacterium]